MKKIIVTGLSVATIAAILTLKLSSPGVYPNVPGALNPDVTQNTIQQTICKSGWTATVRPPVSYTNVIKKKLAAQFGTTTNAGELDHAISIELGGSPTSTQNLWFEPYNIPLGAKQKDVVETWLKRQICNGSMTLVNAQDEVLHDWPTLYKELAGIATSSEDTDI